MKTLQEIKEKYAIEQGFPDWEALQCDILPFCGEMEIHMDEICIRAQKLALEKKIERMKSLRGVYDAGSGQHNILSILIYEFKPSQKI